MGAYACGAPPLGLSLGEALRLSVAHRISSSLGVLPAGATLDLLLAKLRAGLPKDAARRLEALLKRVIVGRPDHGYPQSPTTPLDPAIYTICEEAFLQGFELEIAYVDRQGNPSQRTIQPHGLLAWSPLWYLLAWDTAKAAERSFRLDRIGAATLRRDRSFVPRDPRELFAGIQKYGLDT